MPLSYRTGKTGTSPPSPGNHTATTQNGSRGDEPNGDHARAVAATEQLPGERLPDVTVDRATKLTGAELGADYVQILPPQQ
jgi:hypothetical protein